MKDADSVELKLSVDASLQRSAVEALGLDPLEAQVRLVHFFDTPDLALERAGVVVRARRVQGKGDDTVVKLRPVGPPDLSKRCAAIPSFVVEVDAMTTGFVCSGSFKGVAQEAIRDSRARGAPLRKLFTKEQRAFYAEHAPEGVGLDDLVELGPIFVLKMKGTPTGVRAQARHRALAVSRRRPDPGDLDEVAPSEAFQVAAETGPSSASAGSLAPRTSRRRRARRCRSSPTS